MEHGIPWTRYLKDFDGVSRSAVVAVAMEKAESCSMCGTAEWEWAADPDAYRALQMTCSGCAAKDRARADDDTDTGLPGASIRLVPKGVFERITSAVGRRPLSRRERATP